MKTPMSLFRSKPVKNQQAYLDRLGKMLVTRLPLPQVQDILNDYQEQFSVGMERGKSESALLAAQGSPEEAAAQLLEENPSHNLLRHYLLWGALLVLCLMFAQYFVVRSFSRFTAYLCSALTVPLTAGTLFVLLWGGARAELERQFPPEHSARNAWLFGLPLAAVLVFEMALQLLIANAGAVMEALEGVFNLGFIVQLPCFSMMGIGLALTLWWTVRSVTTSIRYFSGVAHAMGLTLAGVTSLMPFISMTVEEDLLPLKVEALLALLPYLAGLLGALVLCRWLERQFPACFRQRSGGQQDYLDQLGKCLLRWFPAGQVHEILTDYREQFESGLERGKSETAMVEELGRPDTVARDLLAAESPLLRRVARQRTVLWCIPLIPAVYSLVGMFGMYEYGWYWSFLPEMVPVFLTLGTAAMFALLHGWERAEVESCFPPERGRPPLWVHLMPLVTAALMAVGFWYLLDSIPLRKYEERMYNLGPILGSFVELPVLILGALLVWTLSWSFSRSIRYFLASIQAAGIILSMLEIACFMRGIDLSGISKLTTMETVRIMLIAFAPYLTALVLTGALWLIIQSRSGRGKEG